MKEELTITVRLQINAHYKTIKKLLLIPESYENNPKTDNAYEYISFVEKAMQSDYSQIMHLYYFIDGEMTLSSSMHPFSELKQSTRIEISRLFYLSKWLMEGFTTTCEIEGWPHFEEYT